LYPEGIPEGEYPIRAGRVGSRNHAALKERQGVENPEGVLEGESPLRVGRVGQKDLR